VRRAGLVSPSERDLRSLGLTPHGHRHAYGQRLKHAGVAPEIIMRCMYHSAIDSQKVYTEPSRREIAGALISASDRLDPVSLHADNALVLA
jgi:integrase